MRIPLIGIALVAAAAINANAQDGRVTLAAASKIWIEGTSNVHDWKAEATVVKSELDLDAAGLATLPEKLMKKVTLTIPVKGLKSGHGKMDDNIQKALKADKNPDIVYQLTNIEAIAGGTRDAFTLRAVGTLSLAGAETAVTVDIAATRQADGSIKAIGTVPVKMTAFAVKPPTAMLGTIRCGDEVKVKFELVVGQKVIAAVDK
jgi:polyisoprenoid-binding protein YceI